MSSLPFSVLDEGGGGSGRKREREREKEKEDGMSRSRSRARTFQAPATDVDLVKISRQLEGMRQLGNDEDEDEDGERGDGRSYAPLPSSSASSGASAGSSAAPSKRAEIASNFSSGTIPAPSPGDPQPVSTRRDWSLQHFDGPATAPPLIALPHAASASSSSIENFTPGRFMPQTPIESKLDLIINLLEDQQDMRTDRVVEDMLLYACLGIFIIFAIDTFSIPKRYIR